MCWFTYNFVTTIFIGFSILIVYLLFCDYSFWQFPNGESTSPYVFVCENFHELIIKFPMKGKHKICKYTLYTWFVSCAVFVILALSPWIASLWLPKVLGSWFLIPGVWVPGVWVSGAWVLAALVPGPLFLFLPCGPWQIKKMQGQGHPSVSMSVHLVIFL